MPRTPLAATTSNPMDLPDAKRAKTKDVSEPAPMDDDAAEDEDVCAGKDGPAACMKRLSLLLAFSPARQRKNPSPSLRPC